MRAAAGLSAATLAGLAAVHVAWARGSTWPCDDVTELADRVAGTDEFPGPAATWAVAGALAVAAGLVADVVPIPRSARRVGVLGTAVVLGVRGLAGVTGTTERLVGWRTSTTFERLDRTWYGPLCLALGAGAAASARQ